LLQQPTAFFLIFEILRKSMKSQDIASNIHKTWQNQAFSNVEKSDQI